MEAVSLSREQVEWFEDMWRHMHQMYEEGEYEFGDDDACEIANELHSIIEEGERGCS